MIRVKDCKVILEKLNLADHQKYLLNNNNKRVHEDSELCLNSSEINDRIDYMVKIHDQCLENLASVKRIKLEINEDEDSNFNESYFNKQYEGFKIVKEEPYYKDCDKCDATENNISLDHIKLELNASDENKEVNDENKFDDINKISDDLKDKNIKRSFSCPVCKMCYDKIGSLRQHLSSQLCMTGYQCYYCAFKFRNKHEIKHHIGMIHFGKQPMKCPECKYECTSLRKLHQHKGYVHKKSKFTCPYCNEKYSKETTYKTHLEKEEAKKFQCSICNARFALIGKLNAHISKMHKAFQCMLCDIRMSEKSKLHNHMRTVHNRERKFACTICDHVTTQRTHLKTHMDHVHHGVKKFECFHCSKKFAEKKNMESHITSVHLKLRPFHCKLCPSKFTQKSHLNTHVKKFHLQIKLLKCSLCNNSFGDKGSLKKHVDTVHLKLKPHKCPNCDAAFGQRSSLLQHIRLLHSDNKIEYCCSYCDYKSNMQSSLISHVKRRHKKTEKNVNSDDENMNTSVRLFKCIYCKFRCAVEVNFEIHLEQFHKDKKKIKIKKKEETE